MTKNTIVPRKIFINMLGLGMIATLVAVLLVMFIPLPSLPSWAPILLGIVVSVLYYSYEEYRRDEVTTT